MITPHLRHRNTTYNIPLYKMLVCNLKNIYKDLHIYNKCIENFIDYKNKAYHFFYFLWLIASSLWQCKTKSEWLLQLAWGKADRKQLCHWGVAERTEAVLCDLLFQSTVLTNTAHPELVLRYPSSCHYTGWQLALRPERDRKWTRESKIYFFISIILF